ncbi:hypothetical protein [Opitutus sp. GAS368]|uniref:hypothetical protein n=1 Tax=Opitutus sp. GAS368 TaxID=1882749 RepID=UPI00087C8F8E|nr:hypothetical protein [Opitutus sp. GAS368]SDS12751.1 hypothetical protein SAMN05444173_1966 [Opitutus sp. GAS368]
MPTFAERYCAQNLCGPSEFPRKIFWQVLHRHAVPLAPLLGRNYFESDRSLIQACACATSLQQIQVEIQIHPVHAHHGNWLHRHAKLRISTQRLRQLAARCFAEPAPAL